MGVGPNRNQIGKKYVIHQKLANFMQKKDIYAGKLESVIFGMCVFYRPEYNAKGVGAH